MGGQLRQVCSGAKLGQVGASVGASVGQIEASWGNSPRKLRGFTHPALTPSHPPSRSEDY